MAIVSTKTTKTSVLPSCTEMLLLQACVSSSSSSVCVVTVPNKILILTTGHSLDTVLLI